MKVYDVVNFDMINIIKTSFVPSCAEFLRPRAKDAPLVAVGDRESGTIRIFDSLGPGDVLRELSMHKSPVRALRFNSKFGAVVSTDAAGMMEMWSVEDYASPPRTVSFRFKSDTDLYELVKNKTSTTALTVSPNGQYIAALGADRQVRVWNFGASRCGHLSTLTELTPAIWLHSRERVCSCLLHLRVALRC